MGSAGYLPLRRTRGRVCPDAERHAEGGERWPPRFSVGEYPCGQYTDIRLDDPSEPQRLSSFICMGDPISGDRVSPDAVTPLSHQDLNVTAQRSFGLLNGACTRGHSSIYSSLFLYHPPDRSSTFPGGDRKS